MLAADVLYERQSVAPLLALLPRLAPRAWIADPGRPAAEAFLEGAARAWRIGADVRGVVRIYRMELADRAATGSPFVEPGEENTIAPSSIGPWRSTRMSRG